MVHTNKGPLALIILDGWGYSPRTEGNAIARAHTPNYDIVCRNFPMTVLAASGESVGQSTEQAGDAEIGHLCIGTGRVAQTDIARIKRAVASGEFAENAVLNAAFARAKEAGTSVHLIGMLSDGGVHSSTENLFALLRLAKKHDLKQVFVHCILDGLDVQQRTADIYVEALEIKLADIGLGRIATLCGRFFAMDSNENWERTARVFTMLVHAEGERTTDAISAIRNSFLRGISDEFISPIVLEKAPDMPVTTVKNGDLVVYFNHRPETMRQLVRSLSVPDSSAVAKPLVDTVCLTEYDRGFDLAVAFPPEPEANVLADVLAASGIPNFKITEAARYPHLTYYFDGGTDKAQQLERELLVLGSKSPIMTGSAESQSFKIADTVLREMESSPNGVFVVNLPAAGLAAETGQMERTVESIQFVDTCLGEIVGRVREMGGTALITSAHGNCEDMPMVDSDETGHHASANPVPFHFVADAINGLQLRDDGTLADIAPTLLGILGIDKPAEMTGEDLRIR